MIALTRDFHVFASCVTTRLSTVLLSIRYLAKAWNVRALFPVLICHYNSLLSIFSHHEGNCDSSLIALKPPNVLPLANAPAIASHYYYFEPGS
jgi:hypothetical protein